MRTINCALTDDQWASLLYSQRIAEYSQGAPRQREEETMSIIAQCFAIGLGFAVGIEIEERYCEIAAKRLAQGVLL